jgi:uncharacterized protein involved in exopolysaccharide biosynthesis
MAVDDEMNQDNQGPGNEQAGSFPIGGQRVVYVAPSGTILPAADEEFDLFELWDTLWRGRWVIIGITGLVAALALAYVMLAPAWYRAEVTLMPATARSTQALPGSLAGLTGLASLAGISIGGGGTAEPLAVLGSNGFTRDFIEQHKLLPVLLADEWDAVRGRWKAEDPAHWPDVRDAVKLFDEDIRRIQEDKRTGKVTLSIEWTDPVVAADWANALVDSLNGRMRKRALQEAETNLAYLQKELATTDVVTLQHSAGRLMEDELQKAMLARGNEEFSFRVVDRAEAPKWRAHPRRALVMALSVVGGAFLGALVVLLRNAVGRRRAATDDAAQ